jgi:hypothetical protein
MPTAIVALVQKALPEVTTHVEIIVEHVLLEKEAVKAQVLAVALAALADRSSARYVAALHLPPQSGLRTTFLQRHLTMSCVSFHSVA